MNIAPVIKQSSSALEQKCYEYWKTHKTGWLLSIDRMGYSSYFMKGCSMLFVGWDGMDGYHRSKVF